MLNFRQIEIFRAVMIAKTVSGASQMLNCSQPGLSRALKHMEGKLGFLLFNRSKGRLYPTQEAIVLLEEVQYLFHNVEQVNLVLGRLAAGEDRIFRLGAPPSLGHSIIPAVLRDLRRRFKTLAIHFDILPMEQVIDYLVFQRGEFALTVFHVDHPNIVSEKIGEGRMVCILPTNHRLAGRPRLSLKDLVDDPIISFQSDTPHAQIIRSMFEKAGVKLDVSTYVRFAETAVTFVAHGLGVAVIDEFTARKKDFDGARTVPLVEQGILPIYLNRGRFTPRSTVSDAFEVLVRKALSGGAAAGRKKRD